VTTIPAAGILRISDVNGTWSLTVSCPHCGHPHVHLDGGPVTAEPDLAPRESHCMRGQYQPAWTIPAIRQHDPSLPAQTWSRYRLPQPEGREGAPVGRAAQRGSDPALKLFSLFRRSNLLEAFVIVSCVVCGKSVEAKRSNRKYCGNRCRQRAFNGARAVDHSEKRSSDLVERVRGDLAAVGVVETTAGQQALMVAARMVSATADTGSAYAALSRELSRLLEEATAGATREIDPLEELSRRRAAKVNAA
jgi:endogenous inhibitor of DNA gyrase (YacG/DUF329 family)